MLWSDETKINWIGSDGRVVVWKKRGEPPSDRTTTPSVKHGGGNNLMVWGCMGWNGVGKLVEVEGIMDAKQYCDILDEGVVESFEKLDMEEGERYFQQDNDPKHTSKLATTWFLDNNILVIHWPAQSLISIPLNISGSISNANFRNMKFHPKEFMSCGREWLRSGMKYLQRYAKDL